MTRDLFSPPARDDLWSQDDVFDCYQGGIVRHIGGGKSWRRPLFRMADAAKETPDVRMWLDEAETMLNHHWPFTASRIWWSMAQDPWDWRDRASCFLDEVSEDARTKAVRCEARPDRLLRSVLPAYL